MSFGTICWDENFVFKQTSYWSKTGYFFSVKNHNKFSSQNKVPKYRTKRTWTSLKRIKIIDLDILFTILVSVISFIFKGCFCLIQLKIRYRVSNYFEFISKTTCNFLCIGNIVPILVERLSNLRGLIVIDCLFLLLSSYQKPRIPLSGPPLTTAMIYTFCPIRDIKKRNHLHSLLG